MTHSAGILFVTKTAPRQALFLKRGPGGDFPGYWCFPGGRAEPGDADAEATAVREAEEELGFLPEGTREELARSIKTYETTAAPAATPLGESDVPTGSASLQPAEPVDYTTFLQEVDATFEPRLNGEHVGHAWAPVDAPPEPLHPGCRVALDRLTCDELGVARMVASGDLTSPQRYMNVWLFAIRITGTGAAYRKRHDEYVWRDASIYLNDEFLARCNGLPVIFQHPKKSLLNSKEFSDRVIGTVFLPYIRGDEVWGVAKIYDAAAVKIMRERHSGSPDGPLSTSPAVTWRDLSVNTVVKDEDGSTLLIEGKPGLLDHIAVEELGVWDKGGEPSGVLSEKPAVERTDGQMADEEKKEDERREDADFNAKMDKMLGVLDAIGSKVDSVCGRMDAYEERERARDDADRKDAKKDADEPEDEKKEKADRKDAKKDADEPEDEKKEKADRKDAAPVVTKADLDEIRVQIKKLAPRSLQDAEQAALADAQARFDSVFQTFGRQASQPMQGEDLTAYRVRLLRDMQVHDAAWKNIPLAVAAVDSNILDVAERSILAAARAAALNPPDREDGELHEITRFDAAMQRNVTEFRGSHSFVRDHAQPAQFVTGTFGGKLRADA